MNNIKLKKVEGGYEFIVDGNRMLLTKDQFDAIYSLFFSEHYKKEREKYDKA